MGSGGDIFWSDEHLPLRTVRFEEAFPSIENLNVSVTEHGEGNQGLGVRHFGKNSVREFINCSSVLCSGKGFSLGRLLRTMAKTRRARLHVQKGCESRKESGTPCENHFDIHIEILYKNPDLRDTLNPMGMLAFLSWHHEWNHYHFPPTSLQSSAELLKKAGTGTVRMDFLWSDLETAPGVFDWAHYDRIIAALRAQSLCVLGVLHYNPRWRSGPWNQAPQPNDYLRFVRSVVKHFRSDIRYWEIWNEPDHPNYWQPQDGLKTYSSLLRIAADTVRQVDATAQILLGGLSQKIPENLRLLYEQAGSSAFDIVNFHPFVNPLIVGAIDQVKTLCEENLRVMQAFGDGDKPIWLTEIGCPGVSSSKPLKEWWLGTNPSETEQAQWVETLYKTFVDWPNVERVFWAFFRDTPDHFGDGVDAFGVVRENFSLKPAFSSYQAAHKKLMSGRFLS